MTDVEEPRQPTAFGFVAVHRERPVASSSRMRDVVDASAKRTVIPRVNEVEDKRRVHRDRWMQTVRGLPRSIPDAGDKLAWPSGRMQRHTPSVARHDMPRVGQSTHLD